MKNYEINTKCSNRKTIIATHSNKTGSKTEDLTPIVGSEKCINCQFFVSLDKENNSIICKY